MKETKILAQFLIRNILKKKRKQGVWAGDLGEGRVSGHGTWVRAGCLGKGRATGWLEQFLLLKLITKAG